MFRVTDYLAGYFWQRFRSATEDGPDLDAINWEEDWVIIEFGE